MPVYVPGAQPVLTYPVATFTAAPGVVTRGGREAVDEVASFMLPPEPDAVINLIKATWPTFSMDGTALGGDGSTGFDWDTNGGGPPWYRTMNVSVYRHPYVLNPRSIQSEDLFFGDVQADGSIYWHPEYLPPEEKPVNRIGFEWLDEPGVVYTGDGMRLIPPTDVIVDLGIHGVGRDTSVNVDIDWTVYHYAQQPSEDLVLSDEGHQVESWLGLGGEVFLSTGGIQAGEEYTETLSLIDYVDANGNAVLWVSPHLLLETEPPNPPFPADLTNGGGVYFGNGHTVESQTWHYQPPAYRWILDASPVLRHYPRDGDGRGWGGVVRHYPPPRGRRSYGGARQP